MPISCHNLRARFVLDAIDKVLLEEDRESLIEYLRSVGVDVEYLQEQQISDEAIRDLARCIKKLLDQKTTR